MNNWKQGDSIGFMLDDKTGEERSERDFDIMIDQIRHAAQFYGFDLRTYGTWESMREFAIEEQEVIGALLGVKPKTVGDGVDKH